MNIGIEMENPRQLGPVLRTADRMRLEGCINALTREGLSLSLQCSHEALLDHYVRLMLTRLREDAPQHQVEVYFPANTDSLLDRFNAVLADQSVSDATRSPREETSIRVWVVHDAQKVPESEMQLLARLIQNFPGARVRAMLLFHGTEAKAESLTAFGRKLLRWDIDLPTPEQAQDALEMAQIEGRQAQMAQLLRRIGCSPNAIPTTALSLGLESHQQQVEEYARVAEQQRRVHQARHPVGAKLQAAWAQMAAGLTALKGMKLHTASPQQPAVKRLALGAGLALVLTLSIVAWLQPKAFVAKKALPQPASTTPEAAPVRQEPAVDKREQKQGPVGILRASQVQKT